MSAQRFLQFACQFTNGSCGSICIDRRRFQKNGLRLVTPLIVGPASVDEVEHWMREVLHEVVTQTNKECRITGKSGVTWGLRPGCRPVRLGVSERAATLRLILQEEALRHNDDDDE